MSPASDRNRKKEMAALIANAGGTLDLNGKSYACGSIAQHGGSVTNGTLTLPSSLTVDLAEAKAGNCITFQSGSFSFPANATLTLLNADLRDKDDESYTLLRIAGEGTFANVPNLTNADLEPWRLSLGNGGREVQLAIPRGTVLIFR